MRSAQIWLFKKISHTYFIASGYILLVIKDFAVIILPFIPPVFSNSTVSRNLLSYISIKNFALYYIYMIHRNLLTGFKLYLCKFLCLFGFLLHWFFHITLGNIHGSAGINIHFFCGDLHEARVSAKNLNIESCIFNEALKTLSI